MRTLVVVPVRGITGSKSRLAGLFTESERMQLMWSMANHVVSQIPPQVDIAIITRNVDAVAAAMPGVRVVPQLPAFVGLNGSLQQSLLLANAEGYQEFLMLPADLPLVTRHEVELLLAEDGLIVMAGDRDQEGTNGLRVPTRVAGRFRFGMGTGSFLHHLAEGRSLGMSPITVYQPGLAHDLDTPDDWHTLPLHTREWLAESLHPRVVGE